MEYFEIYSPIFKALGVNTPSKDELLKELEYYKEKLEPYITDTTLKIWRALDDKKAILIEGAQGTMLDIDHGTYPYVTSSTTVSAGACSGLGIAPQYR